MSWASRSGVCSSWSQRLVATPAGKKILKSRFKGFNDAFESLYAKQTVMDIPDQDLRADMRARNSELVLKHYTRFYKMFENVQFFTKTNYRMYDPTVVEKYLSRFFSGTHAEVE